MRIFGGQRMQGLMLKLGMEEDVPIESGLITKRIAAAQKAVEAQNFASRKHVLEYDDVMNKQRQAVYGMRRTLLEGKDRKERIEEIVGGIVASVHRYAPPRKGANGIGPVLRPGYPHPVRRRHQRRGARHHEQAGSGRRDPSDLLKEVRREGRDARHELLRDTEAHADAQRHR